MGQLPLAMVAAINSLYVRFFANSNKSHPNGICVLTLTQRLPHIITSHL